MMRNYRNEFVTKSPKTAIVTTDKGFVDWALSINTKNRKPKPDCVKQYAEDMEDGKWELTSQGIGISKNGVLLDGQNRLLANRAAGYPAIPMLVVCGLDDSSQMKVDCHAKRTVADRLALALSIQADDTLAAALRILSGIGSGGRSVFTRKAKIEELLDAHEKYSEYLSQISISRQMRGMNGPFWAAILYGMAHGVGAEKARRFCEQYRTGENLPKNHPVLKLRDKIAEKKSPLNGYSGQVIWFCWVARAFFAAVRGEILSKFYLPEYSDALKLLKGACREVHG